MDATERAEKMHDDSGCECRSIGRNKHIEWFAAEIDEACAEARQEEHDRIRVQHAKDLVDAAEEMKKKTDEGWMNILPAQFELAKKEGFTAAKERAMGIVLDEYWNARGQEAEAEKWLATRISAMTMEEGK